MKKILTLLFFVSWVLIVEAQSWIQLNSKTGKRLNDVYFFNRDTGIVCGDKGLILRTVNGGFNWTPISSGITDQLGYLHFIDQQTGYATGFSGNGTLLKTTDGGKTWMNASLNIPDSRSACIYFVDPLNGYYAIGNKFYQNSKILKTTNGGLSYDTVFRTKEWINYLFFIDKNQGWATASGSNVYFTTDGGNSWDTFRFNCDMLMSGIYFLDKKTGYVGGLDMGSGCFTIQKTTDGGYSWTSVSDSGAARFFFLNPQIAYAVSPDTFGRRLILKSTDGGNSWKHFPTPKEYLNAVFFPEEATGYTVGDSGIILRYSRLFTIKGKITTQSGTPVTQGTIKLIAFSNGQRSVEIDSTSPDANGDYIFSNVQSGRYIILASADTLSFPDAAPTYFGNSLLWNNATILNLSLIDTLTADIQLFENNTIPPGNASISGIVESIDGTRAGNNPIKDVDVTLKKVPGGQIKKTTTNDKGLYFFDNLPTGDYNLFIDIPGLPMDSIIPVKIENQDSSVKNVNFGVDSTGIHVDLSLSIASNNSNIQVSAFPNPFSSIFYLTFGKNGDYHVKIQDITGKTMFSQKSDGNSLIMFDLHSLPAGIYLVHISGETENSVLRVIKKT